MQRTKLEKEFRAEARSRARMAAYGIVLIIAMTILVRRILPPPALADSGIPSQKFEKGGKVVILDERGEEVGKEKDMIETGTSSVPFFPRTLDFRDAERVSSAAAPDTTKYQLIGLGIRTVSFLGIQVYVVGFYIALDDIAKLQSAMIRHINPLASTLVAGEKGQLARDLLDPEKSEEIWNKVLKDEGIRTIVRIVPTRNTDFGHLRDAFVRHVSARAQGRYKEEFGDEGFGEAVGEFKRLFTRGSIPKGRELLMARDGSGKLVVWFDDGKNERQRLGEVGDERISRAVWLNYLAGKSVASEGARKSIVDGVVEFVERPVGTVVTQVV